MSMASHLSVWRLKFPNLYVRQSNKFKVSLGCVMMRKFDDRLILASDLIRGCVIAFSDSSSALPGTCREVCVVMTAFGWATAHLRFPEPVLASEKCTTVSILVLQHAFRFVLSTRMRLGDVASADRLAPDRIGVTAARVEDFPNSVFADSDAVMAAVVGSHASQLASVALVSAFDIGGLWGAGTVATRKFGVKTGPHPGPAKIGALIDGVFGSATAASSDAFAEMIAVVELVGRHGGAESHCGETREGDDDIK